MNIFGHFAVTIRGRWFLLRREVPLWKLGIGAYVIAMLSKALLFLPDLSFFRYVRLCAHAALIFSVVTFVFIAISRGIDRSRKRQ